VHADAAAFGASTNAPTRSNRRVASTCSSTAAPSAPPAPTTSARRGAAASRGGLREIAVSA
jgi:hypothetical protein